MSNIQLVCGNHPKYKGVSTPKVDCITCWKIYATNLKLKLKKVQSGSQRKR